MALKDRNCRRILFDADQVIVKAHHLQVSRSEVLQITRERLDTLEEKQRASERSATVEAK